jgi:Zn-dependent protease/CBS domain-containing protein
MFKSSFRLGRVLGIPIEVHVSWFIVFILVTTSLAVFYFPQQYPRWSTLLAWVVGLATSLLFFVSVLLHELAHSVYARSRGIPVRNITLFIFGGVSQITEEPKTAATEFAMAFAGPLTSFVLAALFGLLWFVTRTVSQPIAALSGYLAIINATLGAFNLIPGFPLDGGRVFRSILWGISQNLERATRWASLVGQGIAYLMIIIGIWQFFSGNTLNGLWLAFIGWFLDNAAQSSYQQVAVQRLLAGHMVQEIMNRDCTPLSPNLTLDELVHDHILATGRRCFPVIEGDTLQGLLTIHNIKEVPREQWATTAVRAVMIPVDKLKTVAPDQGLWPALQEMTEEGVNQLPVMEDRRLLGILARDNVLSFVRTRAELGV